MCANPPLPLTLCRTCDVLFFITPLYSVSPAFRYLMLNFHIYPHQLYLNDDLWLDLTTYLGLLNIASLCAVSKTLSATCMPVLSCSVNVSALATLSSLRPFVSRLCMWTTSCCLCPQSCHWFLAP
ncbi:uncharacterized protein C8R40DRAFT_1133612 [Lentinula edodes]|uniref:uncharacterized protein n=1 Tax=Lentinula edodes TaxID=5353 RepID=UPI001E8E5B72|nr:uncharacterized protein C8R40DRAFT_1133612 [Lentinula edodes]KAH7868700.1 hypothetical protein C8R40DRAFT_1133612 [Lentinula edodes]